MLTSIDEFNELKKAIDGLKSAVYDSTEALHNAKIEVVEEVKEVVQTFQKGKYIQSDNRIIISSPDIVIGNVDRWGVAKGGGTVTIRSGNINIEGVVGHENNGGEIRICAPTIQQYAINPGLTGTGETLGQDSTIVLHAGSIGIQADDFGEKYVLSEHKKPAKGRVDIFSDLGFSIQKLGSDNRGQNANLEDIENSLDSNSTEIQNLIKKIENTLNNNGDKLFESLPPAAKIASLFGSDNTNDKEIFKEQDEFNDAVVSLCDKLENYLKEMFKYKTSQLKIDTTKGIESYNNQSDTIHNCSVQTDLFNTVSEKTNIKSQLVNIFNSDKKSELFLNAHYVNIGTVSYDKVKGKDGVKPLDGGKVRVITPELIANSFAQNAEGDFEQSNKSSLNCFFKNIFIDTNNLKEEDPGLKTGSVQVNSHKILLSGLAESDNLSSMQNDSAVGIASAKIHIGFATEKKDKYEEGGISYEGQATAEDLHIDSLIEYNNESKDSSSKGGDQKVMTSSIDFVSEQLSSSQIKEVLFAIQKNNDILSQLKLDKETFDSISKNFQHGTKDGSPLLAITDGKTVFENDLESKKKVHAGEVIADTHLKGPKTNDQ